MSHRPAQTAIVTGASSGIGAATAVELGRVGFQLMLGARRTERLEKVARQVEEAGGRAGFGLLDVSCADSVERFCTAAESELGGVDVLVNNAGRSGLDLLHELDPDELREDLDVNLLGPILMTRRVLPGMLERRHGHVVFVSSENAIRPRPYQVGYSAAKAGLEAAARVLEMETEGTGVRSLVVRLGPTGSEFGAGMDHERLSRALDAWKYWGVQRHLHWMKADDVARAIVRTLTIPATESVPTLLEVMPGGRKKEV